MRVLQQGLPSEGQLQESQAHTQRRKGVQVQHLQQSVPSDLQSDIPHAHAQRQEAVLLQDLRERILQELRSKETHEEASRHRTTGAERSGYVRPEPQPTVRLRVRSSRTGIVR